jgi:hypothetical protein
MQERILAARTIFFTEEGIFWQCAEISSSEFKENISTNWEYKSSPESARPSKLGFTELSKSWRTNAQEYVTCAIAHSNFVLGGLLWSIFDLILLPKQRSADIAKHPIIAGTDLNPQGKSPRIRYRPSLQCSRERKVGKLKHGRGII